MELRTRNVNTGLRDLLTVFTNGYVPGGPPAPIETTQTRNGPCLTIMEPTLIHYAEPTERVLFHPLRDANPFFHVMEALWMLAGRDDVEPVAYYASNMRSFSDDGKTFNGAYGRRWRKATGYDGDEPLGLIDQLDLLVNHLKADPNSRRAVLQMWNVEDDLLKVGRPVVHPDLGVVDDVPASKDVCCNLSALFSIREVSRDGGATSDGSPVERLAYGERVLDLAVTNRSNDLVWGALGANWVHFTFLQEYLAGRLGVGVGRYSVFSNNLHVYTERHGEKVKDWLEWYGYADPRLPVDRYDAGGAFNTSTMETNLEWMTTAPRVSVPILSPGEDAAVFDDEVKEFVNLHSGLRNGEEPPLKRDGGWRSSFIAEVASPMCRAFHNYKCGDKAMALNWADLVTATDWKFAATEWLKRRKW